MKINFKTKEAYCTFNEYNRLKEVLESTNLDINDFTIHIEEPTTMSSKKEEKKTIEEIIKDWEKEFLDKYSRKFPEPFDWKKEWKDFIPKPGDIPNYFMTVTSKTTNNESK